MAPAGPIAIYGATGYTGRLVAREAVRRDLPIVLAGRNPEKLRRLAGELEADVAVHAAAVDDRDALRHVLGDCAAAINCAGPFSRYGEPVVRAAVETGTHYVDTTGEQLYMKRIVDRYDDAARAAEVAVVCAMGFDYVPGDLIARLAAGGHEPLRELVVAYAVSGFGPTRGTARTTLEMLREGDVAYEEGDWRPAGRGPLRASFDFGSGVGRQTVAKYPSGEVISVPRHTETDRVTSLITTSTLAPVGPLAPLVPLTMPALSLALRTPAKFALDLAIDRLPEGPSENDRQASRFTIVALARGRDGRTARAAVRGRDVYGLTAVAAVHGAALMAAVGYDRAGALSPATAFEPVSFLNFLGDHGVSYEVDAAAAEDAA
jgi:short subunit dehydrogenase-like uncharacterized protein